MASYARVFLPSPQSAQSISPERRLQPAGQYQDKPWALLFGAHCLLVAYLAGTKGVAALSGEESKASSSSSSAAADAPRSSDESTFVGGLLLLVAFAPLLCCAFAYFFVGYVKNHASTIVSCCVRTYVVIHVAAAAVAVVVGVPGLTLFLVLMACIIVCWYNCIKERIPFMAAHLRCACEAVTTHPSMITYSIAMILPNIVWVVLWSLAYAGLNREARDGECSGARPLQHPDDEFQCCFSDTQFPGSNATGEGRELRGGGRREPPAECTEKGLSSAAYFVLLVSFYWGGQVVKNIVHCTCCGAAGTWWFQAQAPNAVSASFRRATTTSFGSICLGSLFVAILKAIEKMLEREKDSACIQCVLQCIRSMLEYFNRFAYVYVALYGLDFRSAGYAVFSLFSHSGWTQIIHDDLLGIVLFFGSMACAVFGMAAGVGVALGQSYVDDDVATAALIVYAIVGFIAGIFAAMQVFAVLDSSFATVLVAWAEDPQALSASHPAHYAEIYAAWVQYHSDVFFETPNHSAKYPQPAGGSVPPGLHGGQPQQVVFASVPAKQ